MFQIINIPEKKSVYDNEDEDEYFSTHRQTQTHTDTHRWTETDMCLQRHKLLTGHNPGIFDDRLDV